MNRAILAALSLSLLPLAACETTGGASSTGTQQPLTAANAPDEDVYQCEEDSPTGSHMRARNCRSRAQKKEEKRSVDQFLHKPQQGPTQQ